MLGIQSLSTCTLLTPNLRMFTTIKPPHLMSKLRRWLTKERQDITVCFNAYENLKTLCHTQNLW